MTENLFCTMSFPWGHQELSRDAFVPLEIFSLFFFFLEQSARSVLNRSWRCKALSPIFHGRKSAYYSALKKRENGILKPKSKATAQRAAITKHYLHTCTRDRHRDQRVICRTKDWFCNSIDKGRGRKKAGERASIQCPEKAMHALAQESSCGNQFESQHQRAQPHNTMPASIGYSVDNMIEKWVC